MTISGGRPLGKVEKNAADRFWADLSPSNFVSLIRVGPAGRQLIDLQVRAEASNRMVYKLGIDPRTEFIRGRGWRTVYDEGLGPSAA